jgi:hypothetical protein
MVRQRQAARVSRFKVHLSPEDMEAEREIAERKGIPECAAGCGHRHYPGPCPLCSCSHRHHIVPKHAIKRARRKRQKERERDLMFRKRVAQEKAEAAGGFPRKKRRTRSMRGK